jgi:hypothetical protein
MGNNTGKAQGFKGDTFDVASQSWYKNLMYSSREVPDLDPMLKLRDEVIGNKCNLVIISALPKAGKTGVVNDIIAKSLTTGYIDGIEGINVAPNINNFAVILGDTELSINKFKANYQAILKRIGYEGDRPDNFYPLALKRETVTERIKQINECCQYAYEKHGGIHAIMIDGGADLIIGNEKVNDSKGAPEAVEYLTLLAEKYECLLINVLHTNPGSEKARGVYGSECQRKSDGTLLLTRKGAVSVISGKDMRYAGETDPVAFRYDKQRGYHVSCEAPTEEDIKQSQVNSLRRFAERIMGQKSMLHKDLVKAVMTERNIQDRRAKEIITDMKEPRVITLGDDKHYRFC